MAEPATFYEIVPASLVRDGEEVCGDQFKVLRSAERTILVLSDGLGSGIKATILARLTAEIIVTMLKAEAPLEEVMETVAGTLPTCRVRGLAYATFTILQIEHATGRFKLASFDSPPPILLRNHEVKLLSAVAQTVGGKTLLLREGGLQHGDFLGLMTDGILHASPGVLMDPGWGWDQVAAFLSRISRTGKANAEAAVRAVLAETSRRYRSRPGDDATFIGVLVRKPRHLIVFTGPPAHKALDKSLVERFLSFPGRRVICGGTTSNLVAEQVGDVVHTDETTAREGIPPVGDLHRVDLVTEGILTLARAVEILRASGGNPRRLPVDRNGAVLLCRELLRADSIQFLAGESVNPCYQNPQLPRSVSIRRSLVLQLSELLTTFQRTVAVEWT